jgi:hypothetical protein
LVRDLSNLALERFVTKPLEAAFLQIVQSIPQAGARADGGPVTTGGAYQVGERGPELFVPSSSGRGCVKTPKRAMNQAFWRVWDEALC